MNAKVNDITQQRCVQNETLSCRAQSRYLSLCLLGEGGVPRPVELPSAFARRSMRFLDCASPTFPPSLHSE